MLRNLIDAGGYIAELGFDEAPEIEETLDRAEKKIFEVTSTPTMHTFISLRESLAEAWERLEKLSASKDELRGIRTGFRELDTLLAGLQKSDLIILAARPSMGKTTLALDIARQTAVKHGTVTGIFSLEMSAQQLVDRMVAAEAKVNSWSLRTGRIHDAEDFARIRDAYDRLSQAPIFIDDQAANTILNMRAVARRLKHEHNLGLLVVDYLQLMAPTTTRQSDSMVQQVTEISRSLKALARELEIPVLALSQLSRAIETRRGKPRLSDLRDSGCLAAETLIQRADTGEQVPIASLVGEMNIPVLSLSENGKLVTATMSKVFVSSTKKLYRVELASGISVRASANHPFLTIRGWNRLDTLAPGVALAVPRSLEGIAGTSTNTEALSDDHLILLAHLLGDGCVLPRQPIHYTSADRANLGVVRAVAQRLFGIVARTVAQENWWHVYLPAPYHLARGKKNPITMWFDSLGLKQAHSYEKKLPQALHRLPAEKLRLFLHHLWATDGSISAGRKEKPVPAVYYASASKELATGVQYLLLRCGILSTLRRVPQRRGRTQYHVAIQGAPMQLRFLREIGSYGKRGILIPTLITHLKSIIPNTNTDTIPREVWDLYVNPARERAGLSWRGFAEEMGTAYNGTALRTTAISRPRLERIASVLADETLARLSASDVYWDEIASITEEGKETVYDATVPEYHNFLANNVIVHNSIEQDADVVMFIHRDDKMNENSDRPNIAEILVEKHRNGPIGKIELYFDEKRTTFLPIEKSDFGALEPSASPPSGDF